MRGRGPGPRRTVLLALALGLGAAVPAPTALGPRYGGELRVVVADAPSGDGPAVPRTAQDRLFLGLVHETLVGIDDEGRPRPGLAEAWTAAADGREWTLTLAPAAFHDGSPVTAREAARSLRRFLRADSAAAAHLARGLEGGEAFRGGRTEALPGLLLAGETALALRWREAPAAPLAPLASPAAAVVGAGGEGAGPFIPTTPASTRGVRATAFLRHVRGRPLLDVVRVTVVGEGGAVPGADVAPGLPRVGTATGLLLLVLDPRSRPFDNPRARARAAAAVDRAQLARHFLREGAPADDLLGPRLLPPWPAGEGRPAPSAPARLQARLALRVSAEVPPMASQRVVAHLAALGLDVTAVPVPAAEAALPGPGGARLLVWHPEVAEAGLALEELAALAGSAAPAAAALAHAQAERHPDRRRAWLQRAEEDLRAAHVLVPLARLPVPLGARPGVHGVRATPSGALVLENAWVEP